MAGFFRVEVKIVKRNSIRSNGTVGENSALKASAYITADIVENTPLKASAYISGQEIQNDENVIVADYSKKRGVLYSAVVLPKDAPKRLQIPEVLWSEVEKIEGKRRDSILFREWICCLEKHLTMEQKFLVAQEYAELLAGEGMAVQYAIHEGHDGNDNDHIHYIGTVRGFEDGKWKSRRVKPQEYLLDEAGNRISVIDKVTGEQKRNKDGTRVWKKSKVQYEDAFNEMHSGNVERWRKLFAEIENQYLPDAFKVTADSYIVQGLDIIPGQHLGKSASNVQRKLEEQVKGLSKETREDYLQKILKQVQQDYRRAYYENSRLISNNKRKIEVQESSEHKELRREISGTLHSVTNYKPQKKYVSNILGKGHLQIEYALADLIAHYKRQIHDTKYSQEADLEMYIKATNLLIKAEDYLFITFTTGVTKSCENFIVQNEYELQKELLKKLGEEIRETEYQISLLQGKEGEEIDTDGLEQQLTNYRERIQEIRSRTIVDTAGRITETATEIRASEERLAELRRRTAGVAEQVSRVERRTIARENKKVRKRKLTT